VEDSLVSGYDKTPPDPSYEPDLGPGGKLFVLAVVAFVVLGSLGWVFIG